MLKKTAILLGIGFCALTITHTAMADETEIRTNCTKCLVFCAKKAGEVGREKGSWSTVDQETCNQICARPCGTREPRN